MSERKKPCADEANCGTCHVCNTPGHNAQEHPVTVRRDVLERAVEAMGAARMAEQGPTYAPPCRGRRDDEAQEGEAGGGVGGGASASWIHVRLSDESGSVGRGSRARCVGRDSQPRGEARRGGEGMTPAEQGRALLEEWKAEHREGGISTCSWCGDEWPCPTSRLIAEVERLREAQQALRAERDRADAAEAVLQAQEACWYWRNRAGKVEPVMVRSVVESPDAVAREEIERLRNVEKARDRWKQAAEKWAEQARLAPPAPTAEPCGGSKLGWCEEHNAPQGHRGGSSSAAETPRCLCSDGWRHCPIHQDEGREPPSERHAFVRCSAPTLCFWCHHHLDVGKGQCGKPASDPIHAPAPEVPKVETRRSEHGNFREKCVCEGCTETVPGCWASGMCYSCCNEDCQHEIEGGDENLADEGDAPQGTWLPPRPDEGQ